MFAFVGCCIGIAAAAAVGCGRVLLGGCGRVFDDVRESLAGFAKGEAEFAKGEAEFAKASAIISNTLS
jgi:hypothetical protein